MALQTICFARPRESPFIVESIGRKPYYGHHGDFCQSRPTAVCASSPYLRAGFDSLVETVRKRGASARLFEELYTAKHPSGAFSKRFADLLDKLKIIDKRLTFHSLRHGAKQALANAGVPLDRIEILLGWSGANRGVSWTYGGEPPLPMLKEAIDAIEFAGLELSSYR